MQFLVPAGILALLALPVIVLLYVLKVRRQPVTVATLFLWRRYRTNLRANTPWQRLRRDLLLFLQLLVALALVLALVRPALTGAAGVGSTTVILLDGSASMQATDVKPSRFAAAVDRARQLAGQMGLGGQMAVVLLGLQAKLLVPPTGEVARIQAGLDQAQPYGGAADLGQGLSLANALVAGHPGASIVLIGDGHARLPAEAPGANGSFTFLKVGSSGENSGIQRIDRSDQNIVITLADYGARPVDVKLEMRADGRMVDVLPVHLDAGSTTQVSWSGLPPGTQVLEARQAADDFPLDDAAWLLTGAPPAHRALLVTAQNVFLERALRLRPGLDLTVAKPADYRPGAYDLYVFDRFVPPGPLPAPALVIDPPAGTGPVPTGAESSPGDILPLNPREPLLRDVSLKEVHVQSAGSVAVPDDWRTLIAAPAGPLLMVHDGEPRVAELTFDVHHSDLPLRPAFPILVQNLAAYLLPSGFEGRTYEPGQSVSVEPEPGAQSVEVLGSDGSSTKLGIGHPIAYSATERPGVYTVRQYLGSAVRESHFLVQFQDPGLGRIAPQAAPAVATKKVGGSVPHGVWEMWPWLVGILIGLLLLEWVVYHREVG